MFPKYRKKPVTIPDRLVSGNVKLHSALDLAAAQAAGACVDMLRSSVYHCFYALNVGLPCTIGTSVGVRNLNTEGNALVTELAFCHLKHLLA